jgi:hypothetical protein
MRSPTYAPVMRALFTFGTYTLMRPGGFMAFDWTSTSHARPARDLYASRT